MAERIKTIRILQIGDVHFPEGMSQAASADIKDDGVAESLTKNITSGTFIESVRRMVEVAETGNVDFLAFMGDLTSRGDLSQYSACVKYLSNLLRMETVPILDPQDILFVAGNHDVSRDIAKTKPEDKFKILSDTLEANGFLAICETELDCRQIISDGCTVSAIGINSCIGCGEKRYLPSRVQDEIFSKIEGDLKTATDTDKLAVLDEVYETLDAPAVASETIGSLIKHVEEADSEAVPLIVAHHNLLPQSLTRLDPYTELVNSGALRSVLTSLGRPAIYLHGHIHTDPIEVITNAATGKSPLVCISAPALESGFNIVEIGFGSQGDPIGCRVIPYRCGEGGYVMSCDAILIPFSGFTNAFFDKTRSALFSKIVGDGYIQYTDLLTWAKTQKWYVDDVRLGNDLVELSWQGAITIEGMDRGQAFWRIKSATA